MGTDTDLPIVILACKVFQDQLERYFPLELSEKIRYLDYGLHKVPRNLKKSLQETLDGIQEPSLVVLGFGLCGNGLDRIKAGLHTLLIPRTDDCIAILLGSYQAYKEQHDKVPGTYYLCKGWLEAGSTPHQEYLDYIKRYGEQEANWLMDQYYSHYQRLAFVAHETSDIEKYREQALKVAYFCERWGMKYAELVGSDDYVQRLAQVAIDLNQIDNEFILISPGGEVTQSQFFRVD